MQIAFTWDDGAQEDIKLFELHNKYNLPGTFFVPTRNREGRDVLTPEQIGDAKSNLISFGGHTKNHVYLTQIPFGQIEEEVVSNQKYLEDILGEPVEHFCLPGGQYTKAMLPLLYKHFKTVRTADTMNFRLNGALCKPAFHIYPRGTKSLIGNACRNLSIADAIYIAKNRKKDYFDIVIDVLKKHNVPSNKDTVVIWGHSWELEEFGLWADFERIMQFVAKDLKDACIPYGCLFVNEE